MAKEALKIDITADNRQAIAGLKAMENELRQFEQAIKRSTDPTQIQRLQQNIDVLKQKISAVPTDIKKMDSAVKGNTQTWLNFGRVIQDAPYGFQGIANNLTQLIPAVGALGFAFSALIAGIEFSNIGFRNWSRGSKEAKDEAEAFRKELAKEQVQLQTLYTTATNANQPLEARKQAVKELRDNYGNYLKNFSDEQIMAGKAASAYNALSEAIIKAAKARAAQDKLQKIQAERLDIEEQIATVMANANKKAADNTKKIAERQGQSLKQRELSASVESAQTVFLQTSETVAKLSAKLAELDIKANALGSTIQQNTVEPFKKLETGSNKVADILKDLQKEIEGLQNQLKLGIITPDEFNTEKIHAIYKAMQDLSKEGNNGAAAFAKLRQEFDALTGTRFGGFLGPGTTVGPAQRTQNPVQAGGVNGNNPIQKILETQQNVNLLNQQVQAYNELVAIAANNTQFFAGIFNDLGNALLQGQSLGDALGNTFKKLAVDIAAAAAKALIFQAILSAIGGGIGGLGGSLGVSSQGGMAGFGSLFSKFLGLKGFATGGTVSGPTSGYPVMLHGTEHIMRPDQLNRIAAGAARMGAAASASSPAASNERLVASLSGTQLLLWLQRSNYSTDLKR